MTAVVRLDRDAFAEALRQGRGRARLHAMAYGLDGVADLVQEACLADLAYDRQCEEERSGWLYPMFKDSPYRDEIAKAIVAALDAPLEEVHCLEQVCNLACLMALDGDEVAAKALRRFVWSQAFMAGDTIYGGPAIARLDGVQAIVALVRRLGAMLRAAPDEWVEDLDDLTEHSPYYDDALAALAHEAAGDETIAHYLDRHRQRLGTQRADKAVPPDLARDQYRQRIREQYPLDRLLEAARSGENLGLVFYRRFGNYATEAELRLVLNALNEVTEPEACRRLLHVFQSVPMPNVPERIWALADDADDLVRSAALCALAQVRDDRVGELGRKRLADPAFSADDSVVLALLVKNYRQGDEALVMSALKRLVSMDDDQVHDFGFRVLDLFDEYGGPELAPLAEWAFQSNPCSMCRGSAYRRLAERACLPPDIAHECRYEADADTRQQAAERAGGGGQSPAT